ncbi:MAG: hypothetical protein ACREUR_09530 [Nitrosospira sp.]
MPLSRVYDLCGAQRKGKLTEILPGEGVASGGQHPAVLPGRQGRGGVGRIYSRPAQCKTIL